jgi:hypothetical protein
LRRNAIPIASLAVIAVVLTTAAVAFLGWRFAGLPIAAQSHTPRNRCVRLVFGVAAASRNTRFQNNDHAARC